MIKRIWTELPKQHVHLGSFLLRVGLAVIFIFHGYLKLSQDGGRAWTEVLDSNAQMAVAWGETVCGVALLVGLFSRLAAVGLVVIMVGAIVVQTGRYDFIYVGDFPRANPSRIPTGAEYNFALIVMCLAVVAIGSGVFSIDHCVKRRLLGRPA
ncbi:MAG TPA: DoxX family protein [Urbifossiella sp.]|nr:DoxX family protein [Urbifossiella sp.]